MTEVLEPLVSTIETIKARITTHGPSLRENETRTRTRTIAKLPSPPVILSGAKNLNYAAETLR